MVTCLSLWTKLSETTTCNHNTQPQYLKNMSCCLLGSNNPRKKHGLPFPQTPAMGWGGWRVVTTTLKDEMDNININSPAKLSLDAAVFKQTPGFQKKSFPFCPYKCFLGGETYSWHSLHYLPWFYSSSDGFLIPKFVCKAMTCLPVPRFRNLWILNASIQSYYFYLVL